VEHALFGADYLHLCSDFVGLELEQSVFKKSVGKNWAKDKDGIDGRFFVFRGFKSIFWPVTFITQD
jgi:hypothetical protein